MRLVLFTCACFVLLASQASACRGLWEYPDTMKQLANMEMEPVAKKAYEKRLEDGYTVHQDGHASKDKDKMKEAISILDKIKSEMAK